MKKIFLLLTFLTLGSIFIVNATALQSSPGKISGKVIDKISSEALIGTNITIEGTSLGAAADLDGGFFIPGIPPGSYSIKFSYLGYKELKQDIEIQSGESLELIILLEPQSIIGEEVIITTQAKGQRSAMNQQRSSNAIVDIVASDRIREVPDVNAAESIGRLPGVSLKRSGGEGNKVVIRGLSPKYSIVQLDGVRLTGVDLDRGVGLSGITSEMLDGIELSKSLTPDKDADAIGGIINLRTRVAQKGFHVDAFAQTGYNDLEKSLGNYKFSLGIGNRFFEDKLGVLINAGTEQVIRSSDRFSASYNSIVTASQGDSLKTNNASIREVKAIRNRKFASMVLDFKNDFMTLKFNNTINHMTNQNETRDNEFRFGENDFRMRITEDKPIEAIRTHSLSSAFKLASTTLNINLSYNKTQLDKSLDRYTFVDDYALKDEYASIPEGDKFFKEPSYLIDKYYDVPSAYSAYLDNDVRDTTVRFDDTKTAEIDWKIPFNLSKKVSGYLKVGGKYLQKNRSSDRESFESYYHGGLGSNSRKPRVYEQFPELLTKDDIEGYLSKTGIPAINFDDPDYDYGTILNDRYQLGWSPDLDRLKEVHNYDLYPADQIYRLGVQSADQDYLSLEKLMATYIMAEINIGKRIMILPGVRYEYMQTEYTANYIWEDPFAQDGLKIGYPDTVSVNDRSNKNWFPSINMKIDVSKAFDIRAAYYKSASRPDYRLLSPAIVSDNARRVVNAYNPFLKPSIANNYDLGFSFYNNKFGLFSVNLFYKNISDLIYRIPTYETQYFDVLVDAPDGFIESLQKPRVLYSDELIKPEGGSQMPNYPINNPNLAKLGGIELSWQTNFWYLNSPILRGIVLNLNYSRIWSQTEYPYLEVITTYTDDFPIPKVINTPYYRTRTGRMLDQPTSLFNASLGWDYKGFSSRISLRSQVETLQAIDPVEDLKDEISGQIIGLDLSLKQEIHKGLYLSLDVINLTQYIDESYYRAQSSLGSIDMPKNAETYGLTAQLGLRYVF
jgi:TonB-dependent receptor